jgi:hypothetical protein
MPLVSGEALIGHVILMATLYAIGYTIAFARGMTFSLKLTIAGQTLLLGTILSFYVDNFLATNPPWIISNVVFIFAVLVTMISVFVLGYETQRLPQSQIKVDKFAKQFLAQI